MDELISKNKLLGDLKFCRDTCSTGEADFWEEMIETVKAVPPADAVQSTRGEWVRTATKWQHCSVCKVVVDMDAMYRCKSSLSGNFSYCPNCGAKMGA